MISFFKSYKWLLLALIIGGFLRIFDFNQNPRAMYGDELTMVYDSYSLIEGGTDQLGNSWPITFQMGAGRPAGYVYGSIPFVYLFGPNELGVRSLSMISGISLIFVIFLLSRKLFSSNIGFISAWLMAISPWGVSLSRAGFEANFALLLATSGVVAAIYAKKKIWLVCIWALLWGIAIHTYPTYKLLLPIFGIVFFSYVGFRKEFQKNLKIWIISFSIILFFGILALSQLLYGGSESRFFSINIFSDETVQRNIITKVNSDRERSDLPKIVIPYLHNKYFEYGGLLVNSYINSFSPQFLFISGDGNPRHNPGESGGFYLIEMVSILAGLISAYLKSKRIFYMLLMWVVVGPLGTALLGVPHFLRSSFMLVPLIIFSAVGFYNLWINQSRLKIVLRSVIVFGIVLGMYSFLIYLFAVSANKSEEFWSYPAKLASEKIVESRNMYDYIIVSDRIDDIEFAYPVYAKIDSRLVISQNKNRSMQNGLSFKNIGNVYIGKIPDGWHKDFFDSLHGSVLFIGSMYDNKFVYHGEHLIDRRGKELIVVKHIK